MKRFLNILLAIGILYISPSSHARDQWLETGTATEGKYLVAFYKSKIEPMPLNQIHSWVLHIATPNRVPIKSAEISVSGGMPAHNHGLPTSPEVTEIGEGDYLLEGLKFSMTGVWEIVLHIHVGNTSDKITFSINL